VGPNHRVSRVSPRVYISIVLEKVSAYIEDDREITTDIIPVLRDELQLLSMAESAVVAQSAAAPTRQG
jgi:hypothetical protein